MRNTAMIFPVLTASLAILSVCQLATSQTTKPAQPPHDYGAEAREVMASFQKTFWDPQRGVYVKSSKDRTPDYVWRQAAAFSALVGAARNEPRVYGPIMNRCFHSLDAYWDFKAPIPAYEPAPTKGNGHDKYYDDNAWIVITFAEAYQLTGEGAYLSRARETARFVASGWDEQLGGGIWWHQLHKGDSKNVCSNGPSAVGFLALARLTPPEEARKWRELAQKTVDWTCEKLQASDGLFDDHLIVATGQVRHGKLTYNAAMMLRACLGLYRQTGRTEYLGNAKRIGKAADWFLDKKTGVYRDPLKFSQFMVEADLDLYRATGEPYLLARAQANADAYYAMWKRQPPSDMMSNSGIPWILWCFANTKPKQGRAFWRAADKGSAEVKPEPVR
jgi:hypothetical protein